MERHVTRSPAAGTISRCSRCHALFASRRAHCPSCDATYIGSRLGRCPDCEVSLLSVERRTCPLCGAVAVDAARATRAGSVGGTVGRPQ